MENKQTAVDWLMIELYERGFVFSETTDGALIQELYDEATEKEKQQSLELIELTAQLTGVATVDKEIAKMKPIDVYNLFYKQTNQD